MSSQLVISFIAKLHSSSFKFGSLPDYMDQKHNRPRGLSSHHHTRAACLEQQPPTSNRGDVQEAEETLKFPPSLREPTTTRWRHGGTDVWTYGLVSRWSGTIGSWLGVWTRFSCAQWKRRLVTNPSVKLVQIEANWSRMQSTWCIDYMLNLYFVFSYPWIFPE